MSLIGKLPVPVPDKVKVSIDGQSLTVDSGKEKQSITIHPEIHVALSDDGKQVLVTRKNDEWSAKSMHGTTRALINNMIKGLTEGFSRELDIVGVGWLGKVQGDELRLSIGYADEKVVKIPKGVNVEITGNTHIKVSGTSKQAVGQLAAVIRGKRKPEPYNGKGIKYTEEVIQRKAGKAFGS